MTRSTRETQVHGPVVRDINQVITLSAVPPPVHEYHPTAAFSLRCDVSLWYTTDPQQNKPASIREDNHISSIELCVNVPPY